MNRGVDRQPIFFADADRVEFGRGLAKAFEEHGVVTLAYCLMTNHVHMVLRAPPGALSPAMHQLTSAYSHWVNQRLGRDGPLFRGRFHSIPVETDSYLIWVTRYVHRNALDLPGIRSPEHHRWSSYRAYLGRRPVAAFLDLRPILDLVGGPSELQTITEDSAVTASTGDVRQLTRCAIAVDDLAHPAQEPSGGHLARTLLVLLADRATDPGIRSAAASLLGQRSPGASRVALHRAEKRLRAEPSIARCLAWVDQTLTIDPSSLRVRSVPGTDRTHASQG